MLASIHLFPSSHHTSNHKPIIPAPTRGAGCGTILGQTTTLQQLFAWRDDASPTNNLHVDVVGHHALLVNNNTTSSQVLDVMVCCVNDVLKTCLVTADGVAMVLDDNAPNVTWLISSAASRHHHNTRPQALAKFSPTLIDGNDVICWVAAALPDTTLSRVSFSRREVTQWIPPSASGGGGGVSSLLSPWTSASSSSHSRSEYRLILSLDELSPGTVMCIWEDGKCCVLDWSTKRSTFSSLSRAAMTVAQRVEECTSSIISFRHREQVIDVHVAWTPVSRSSSGMELTLERITIDRNLAITVTSLFSIPYANRAPPVPRGIIVVGTELIVCCWNRGEHVIELVSRDAKLVVGKHDTNNSEVEFEAKLRGGASSSHDILAPLNEPVALLKRRFSSHEIQLAYKRLRESSSLSSTTMAPPPASKHTKFITDKVDDDLFYLTDSALTNRVLAVASSWSRFIQECEQAKELELFHAINVKEENDPSSPTQLVPILVHKRGVSVLCGDGMRQHHDAGKRDDVFSHNCALLNRLLGIPATTAQTSAVDEQVDLALQRMSASQLGQIRDLDFGSDRAHFPHEFLQWLERNVARWEGGGGDDNSPGPCPLPIECKDGSPIHATYAAFIEMTGRALERDRRGLHDALVALAFLSQPRVTPEFDSCRAFYSVLWGDVASCMKRASLVLRVQRVIDGLGGMIEVMTQLPFEIPSNESKVVGRAMNEHMYSLLSTTGKLDPQPSFASMATTCSLGARWASECPSLVALVHRFGLSVSTSDHAAEEIWTHRNELLSWLRRHRQHKAATKLLQSFGMDHSWRRVEAELQSGQFDVTARFTMSLLANEKDNNNKSQLWRGMIKVFGTCQAYPQAARLARCAPSSSSLDTLHDWYMMARHGHLYQEAISAILHCTDHDTKRKWTREMMKRLLEREKYGDLVKLDLSGDAIVKTEAIHAVFEAVLSYEAQVRHRSNADDNGDDAWHSRPFYACLGFFLLHNLPTKAAETMFRFQHCLRTVPDYGEIKTLKYRAHALAMARTCWQMASTNELIMSGWHVKEPGTSPVVTGEQLARDLLTVNAALPLAGHVTFTEEGDIDVPYLVHALLATRERGEFNLAFTLAHSHGLDLLPLFHTMIDICYHPNTQTWEKGKETMIKQALWTYDCNNKIMVWHLHLAVLDRLLGMDQAGFRIPIWLSRPLSEGDPVGYCRCLLKHGRVLQACRTALEFVVPRKPQDPVMEYKVQVPWLAISLLDEIFSAVELLAIGEWIASDVVNANGRKILEEAKDELKVAVQGYFMQVGETEMARVALLRAEG